MRAGHRRATQELVLRYCRSLTIRLGCKNADARSSDIWLDHIDRSCRSARAESGHDVAVRVIEIKSKAVDRSCCARIACQPRCQHSTVRLSYVHTWKNMGIANDA